MNKYTKVTGRVEEVSTKYVSSVILGLSPTIHEYHDGTVVWKTTGQTEVLIG